MMHVRIQDINKITLLFYSPLHKRKKYLKNMKYYLYLSSKHVHPGILQHLTDAVAEKYSMVLWAA